MRFFPASLSCLAATGALLLLSACGFQPLYATNTRVAPALAGVEVDSARNGRPDYLVGLALRDRLRSGSDEPAIYVLRTQASSSSIGTALTIDQVASRILLSVSVSYALYDRVSGRMLTQDSVAGQASFDVPVEPYAAIRAEQEATERAAQEAADRLIIELATFVRNRNLAAATPS